MSLSIQTARGNLENAKRDCRRAATHFGSRPWNEFDQAWVDFLPYMQAVRENSDQLMRLLNEEAQTKAALAKEAESKRVEQKEAKGAKGEGLTPSSQGATEEAKAGPLKWCYGPNEKDPDPGSMWCLDCGGRVWILKEGEFCEGCKRSNPVAP